ncbi:hypothetical protein CSKR_111260 [Clonorchis sinensis]|uniref:Uncharacterized protein n=1 Tax=Clonorchis sinensis TaxID=79923 RepID=A0A419PCR7_CLOSI|nr:hypothetical protein CSKR_111260 [Clonorchis sinensis]
MCPVSESPSRETAMTSAAEFAGTHFHASLPSHCLVSLGSFRPFAWLCEKNPLRKSVDWYTEHVDKPLTQCDQSICHGTVVTSFPVDGESFWVAFDPFDYALVSLGQTPRQPCEFSGQWSLKSTPQKPVPNRCAGVLGDAGITYQQEILEVVVGGSLLKGLYEELVLFGWTRSNSRPREEEGEMVRGSKPTSASRHPLSKLGQPGSIPALVLPSGGMVVRHRKGATADLFIYLLKKRESVPRSVFNTDALLPYNHDLFENLIVKKRIKTLIRAIWIETDNKNATDIGWQPYLAVSPTRRSGAHVVLILTAAPDNTQTSRNIHTPLPVKG